MTWPLPQVLHALLLGLCVNAPTLRDVEALGQRLSSWIRAWVPGRISDSTLDAVARQIDPTPLHDHLVSQVRELYRKKRLTPDHLPCGVATVDGKNLATLTHSAEGTAQPRHHKDGRPNCLAQALRSTLTSSVA
ncbi:MAG: hypothetical protein HY731_05620 [Candidatus Tectomicrobia bacterium]|nr:hypothetical protein [Candidatus Tectomicrobia bacterium]